MLRDVKTDTAWMECAWEAAIESKLLGDYAIGSVIVKDDDSVGVLIARAGNRIRTETDPTSHTEVTAIRMACRDLGSRYLTGCTLYSTHAPCIMCLGACIWSKVDRIVYALYQSDIKAYGDEYGNDHFKWRALGEEPEETYNRLGRDAHPDLEIVGGFMREQCLGLFHTGEDHGICPTCAGKGRV